jgi:hypothetical protein
MLPALARAACAYSDPAELVLDPMCGIGTTLVEAIHLNRDAIGVELEPRWTAIAAGNVVLAREQAAVRMPSRRPLIAYSRREHRRHRPLPRRLAPRCQTRARSSHNARRRATSEDGARYGVCCPLSN